MLDRSRSGPVHALSLKLGTWFEARASGWGLVAILALVGLLLAAGLVGAWLR